MQTVSILDLLRIQGVRMQTKMREAERKKFSDKLSLVKNWSIQLRFRLLRCIYEALWGMHLLKTSVMITKTPLTTLKSLFRSYFNFSPVLISNLKERTFRTSNEIREALVRNLQLHWKKHKEGYDKASLKY